MGIAVTYPILAHHFMLDMNGKGQLVLLVRMSVDNEENTPSRWKDQTTPRNTGF